MTLTEFFDMVTKYSTLPKEQFNTEFSNIRRLIFMEILMDMDKYNIIPDDRHL